MKIQTNVQENAELVKLIKYHKECMLAELLKEDSIFYDFHVLMAKTYIRILDRPYLRVLTIN